MGAESAGKQLHIDPRTIRKWMGQAGAPPELDGDAGTWQRLFELALARTEAALASGKLSATATATIAGIAQRNLEKVRDRPAPPQSAVAARDAFYDWLAEGAAEAMGSNPTEEDLDATIDAIESMNPMLLVRANAEPGQPHRQAMLAWFSGRPEIPAGEALPWAQDQTRALLAEHGSLEGLREWRARGDAEQDAADLVMKERVRVASLWAAQGYPAAECWTRAADGPPGLDAKALELLDQA